MSFHGRILKVYYFEESQNLSTKNDTNITNFFFFEKFDFLSNFSHLMSHGVLYIPESLIPQDQSIRLNPENFVNRSPVAEKVENDILSQNFQNQRALAQKFQTNVAEVPI